MSIIIGGFSAQLFNLNYFVGVFIDGMYTAGSVWAINAFVEFFEESRIKS